MIRVIHLRRLFAFATLVVICFIGLGAQLYRIQVVKHGKYTDVVEGNTVRSYVKPPRRGDILDANANQLATSLPIKRVLADPSLIYPYEAEVARVVAPLIAWKEAELHSALRLYKSNEDGTIRTNRFVDLKRKLTVEQWGSVTQAMSQLTFAAEQGKLTRLQKASFAALRRKGIYGADDYQRVYPSTNLASHILGFVQEVERIHTISSSRSVTYELNGIYGIEHWLDAKLKGTPGWRHTETDRRQRELVVYRGQDVDARPGLSVVLTLDMFIQNALEEQLRKAAEKYNPVSCGGIVMRPRTGEILALCSLPDFDPNLPGKAKPDALRNRLIYDRHEPGSTFKIVVVSAALNENAVTLNDVFFCENGRWSFKNRSLHDHDGGYGDLTVQSIITKSSNIGSAKIAVYRLGEEKLYDYMTRFGFGKKTGITLEGEGSGRVWPVKQWDGLAISRIPMGHGVDVTHLQMVMAMAAIANEGRLMRPMLIKGLQDASGTNVQHFQPQLAQQAVSPRAARQMVAALKTVPAKGGTAEKAALEHYTVAGKTGTAQVPYTRDPNNPTALVPKGYKPGKYVSSFIGFFPADNPEVVISILLDEPDIKKGYYGGQTAAPYFKAVAEQVANYLKIKPDKEEAQPTTLAAPTNSLAAVHLEQVRR